MKRTIIRICSGILAAIALTGCGEAKTASAETEKPQSNAVQEQAAETKQAAQKPLVLATVAENYEAEAQLLYNAEGQVVRKIQESWGYITEYEYYDNGCLKQEVLLKDGVPASMVEYDASGNPMTFYEYEGEEAVATAWYTNEYDSEGRLVETYMEEESGYCEAKTYTYHDDGSYTYTVEYSQVYDGGLWVDRQESFTYDSEDRILDWSIHKDDGETNLLQQTFVYDTQGNLLKQVYVEDYMETSGYSSRSEYTYENSYDENGRLVRSEGYNTYQRKDRQEDGTVKEQNIDSGLVKVITYEYDEAGRLIRETHTEPEYDYTYENIWEYDENGNLIYYLGEDGELSYAGISIVENTYTYLPLDQVQWEG